MKIIKRLPVFGQVILLLTFIGIFTYIYKKSDKRGLVRIISAFKAAAIITLALSSIPTETSQITRITDSNRIERVNRPNKVKIFAKSVRTSDIGYFNYNRVKNNSSRALVLSRKIKSQNSNLYSESIVSKTLQIRGGADYWKFGPGSKARGAAVQNHGKSSGLFVDAFTPPNPYGYQHRYPARVPIKAEPNSFQPGNVGGNNNNYGGNSGGSGSFSDFKGGPSPYKDKFNYDNPNHTRENVQFVDRRVDHAYDRHAKKCFGMEGNRNKINKQEFIKLNQNHIQSPKTKKINGSYRYADPTYHYIQGDLVVTVNATSNEFISVRNATKSQLEKLEIDGNLGLDTRPEMVLRLRGPNSTCY